MAGVPYGLALLLFVAVLVAWLLHLLFKWRHGWPQCEAAGARLPPGSRGLPLIGETLEFFARSPSLEFPSFFKRRLERYGPIFRTNVIGEDMIVSLDPEFNSLVMRQEEVFPIGYPNNFLRFFGDDNMNATGSLHRHVRGHVLRLFGPENLRLALLHDVQRAARAALLAWLDQPAIVVREAISRMIFSAIAKKLISHDDSTSQLARLWESFREVVNGLIAFPLCIPGTTFYRCMQGRRNVMKTLEQQLQERKSAAKRESVDFLDLLIDELNKQEPILNEKIALNLLFGLMIASTETTSIGLTTVLKFLTDNPKALHELTGEHQDIRKRKADPDSEITWEEYKSMKFTSHVIHESLRLANVAPLVFRKAKQDVHIKGYVIPEGSKIMICTSVPHLNPKVYEDPHVFYPWRWKKTLEQIAVVGEYHRQLLELRQEKEELCRQAERWLNSDEKTLADSLDYEKEESRKLWEKVEFLLRKLKEANSATEKLQGEINKKEDDMKKLQNEAKDKTVVIQEISRISKDKDQEIARLRSRQSEMDLELGKLETEVKDKTLIYSETVRIAKANAEDIKSWENRHAETIASHDEEIKKLDSRLVEQVVEIKQLREASTRTQQEMESID